MLKMMEKKNNDKGELIDRTAWLTRLQMVCEYMPITQSVFLWRKSKTSL